MAAYNVQPLFHVKPNFYEEAREYLTRIGVPDLWIQPWSPADLLQDEKHYGNNAAILLDESLDRFKHILVIDADTGVFCPPHTDLKVPIFERSLDKCPHNRITWDKNWKEDYGHDRWQRDYARSTPDIKNHQSEECNREFYDIMAKYSNAEPAEIKTLLNMNTVSWRPLVNGFLIWLPTAHVKTDFRQFCREAIPELHNEEAIGACWEIRDWINNGRPIPPFTLGYRYDNFALNLHWHTARMRNAINANNTCILHFNHFDTGAESAYWVAQLFGGTHNECLDFEENMRNYYFA